MLLVPFAFFLFGSSLFFVLFHFGTLGSVPFPSAPARSGLFHWGRISFRVFVLVCSRVFCFVLKGSAQPGSVPMICSGLSCSAPSGSHGLGCVLCLNKQTISCLRLGSSALLLASLACTVVVSGVWVCSALVCSIPLSLRFTCCVLSCRCVPPYSASFPSGLWHCGLLRSVALRRSPFWRVLVAAVRGCHGLLCCGLSCSHSVLLGEGLR